MKITITNKVTGETISLSRNVCQENPEWVHAQLGTSSESELQNALSNYHPDAYYDANGEHTGPDCDGVSVYARH